MQAKDVPDLPILALIAQRPGVWHCWFPVGRHMPSIRPAMPAHTPDKVVLAKMRQLEKRDLITGCTCGCRGDYEVTIKALALLASQDCSQGHDMVTVKNMEEEPARTWCQRCGVSEERTDG